jgi:hypothetical protein
MKLQIAVCLVSVLAGVPAQAQTVYKCEEGGKITYTDQPCSPSARPARLPDLIVAAPPTRSQQELARAHEARIARDRSARDRADAEWLKQHGNMRDREQRVRKAILEHRVIKGMTAAEVRRSLGEPDQVASGDSFGTAKESWTYTIDGQTRTVNFKSGEVISTSARKRGRR